MNREKNNELWRSDLWVKRVDSFSLSFFFFFAPDAEIPRAPC